MQAASAADASTSAADRWLHRKHTSYVAGRLQSFHTRLAALPANNDTRSPRRPNKYCLPRWWHLRVAVGASVIDGRRTFNTAATFIGDALKPLHRHKAEGALKLLQQHLRVEPCNTLLHEQVASLPNRSMTLYYVITDWPVVQHGLLPVFEHCTSASATGVPIPDFTFWHYPAINPKSLGPAAGGRSGWEAARQQLGELHATLGPNRTSTITWRGDQLNEPGGGKEKTLPGDHRFRRSRMLRDLWHMRASLSALNVSSDVVHISSRYPTNQPRTSWIDMCRSRYMMHVDGYSYAAALKFRLACGAVVLRIAGANSFFNNRLEAPIEWFEAATPLTPGVEYVAIDANRSNLLDEVRQLQSDPLRARAISDAAATYAATAISPAAVSSYLAAVLTAYAALFARWSSRCALAKGREPDVPTEPAACAARAAADAAEVRSPTGLLPVVCSTLLL